MSAQGVEAEKLAADFLVTNGLRFITKNYRCRFGEIDLIMQDKDTLVFIEVRLRAHQAYGGAAESITLSKQKKLIMTANHYLQKYGEQSCRFDAVLMNKTDFQHIEWIKHAFDA